MKQNEKVITALREAAEWIENHPELPPIYCSNIGVFTTYGRDVREDLVTVAKAMGHAEKGYSGDNLFLKKNFGGAAEITYVADRGKVCERIVTGTRVVPPQPEVVIPAKPEHEEEIVEWRCKPLMDRDQIESGVPALTSTVSAIAIAEDDIPF